MLTNKFLFRALLICSWAFNVAALIAWQLLGSQLPDSLQQYEQSLENSPHTIMVDLILIFGLIAFVLYIVANVGLFRFRLWARPLYLGSYAALIILMLLDGQPTVETAIEEFFAELAMLADGAIIGMAYFPSVREDFS